MDSFLCISTSLNTFKTEWLVNGSTLSGVTSNTLTGADFDKDEIVSCSVPPHDGSDDGAPITSNAVTIDNTAQAYLDVEGDQVGEQVAAGRHGAVTGTWVNGQGGACAGWMALYPATRTEPRGARAIRRPPSSLACELRT